MNEQQLVASLFSKHFGNWRDPIVLYGVGRNTQAILEQGDSKSVVGLIDPETTGKTLWNQPVLSLEQVAEISKTVVIVARESVVSIIFNRIKEFVDNNGIDVYTVQGKHLNVEEITYNNEDFDYWNCSLEDLKQEIDSHDLISFDIFDTLVMRNVLRPADVFDLVEIELRNKFLLGIPFKEFRIQAEIALPPVLATFDQIYDQFKLISGVSWKTIEQIKLLEIEMEKRVLVPRQDVVDIFNYAVTQNKKVVLTTDMYLPKKILIELLTQCGITGFYDIYISSDLKKSKKNGSLFVHLKENHSNQNILHIGDNRIDDIEKASECDIDTFYVLSSYEMLMASSMQTILCDVETIGRRIHLGLFIAHAFNSPFVLNRTKGHLSINSLEDMGYLFVAPLLVEFMKWLSIHLSNNEFDQMLFPSRDGFLIEQLYQKIKRATKKVLPEGIYFKTSRRALNSATLYDKNSIVYLLKRPFKGTLGELLQTRYGVTPNDDDLRCVERVELSTRETVEMFILSYSTQILANSERERKRYLRYLDEKGILFTSRLAVFDLVSSGTIPYFMGKLLNTDLIAFLFASMNMPNDLYPEIDRIHSAFGSISSYGIQNNVSKHYLFLETVLTDPDPSLISLSDDLEPQFEMNQISHWEEMEKVQNGIIAFYEGYQRITSDILCLFNESDIEFVDTLFGYLFSKDTYVDKTLKESFANDDSYSGEKSYSSWC